MGVVASASSNQKVTKHTQMECTATAYSGTKPASSTGMSDLLHRVADRHKVERLQRAIVASRWMLARRMLAPGLRAVLPELKVGEYAPVEKALDDLWMIFEISESSSGDWGGSTFTINAEWFYGLGPRIKTRVKSLVKLIRDTRREITWNKNRGPTDDRLIAKFEEVAQEAAWLEGLIPQEDGGFPHGDFTVIPVKGVSAKQLDACLAALDKAVTHIRSKFPQVLYGKVYLGTSVGKGYGNVAVYMPDHDTLALSTRTATTVGDVHAICHELGHRYFYKLWKDKSQRDAFYQLSVNPVYEEIVFDKPTRGKLADEFLSNAEKMRAGGKPRTSDLLGAWIKELQHRPQIRDAQALGRKFTYDKDDSVREALWEAIAIPSEGTIRTRTDKILRGPLAVTPYGAKAWTENFAEAFAFYVMGKPLPEEIGAIMAKLG